MSDMSGCSEFYCAQQCPGKMHLQVHLQPEEHTCMQHTQCTVSEHAQHICYISI